MTVAIIDSGVAAGNQHFQGPDGPVVLPGIDLTGENTDGRVDVGEHGTAIAGAIAAQELPKEMGSGLVGVAPEAKILPVRVDLGLDQHVPQKEGEEPFMSKVGRGIQWAADQGAQIIVVAQSSPLGDPQLEAAINAVRGRALVVASTGNVYQGQEADKVVYPAAYPGVLGVTASNADGSASEQQVHGAHVKLAVPAGVILTTWFDQADCLVGGYEGDQPLPSSSYATAYAGGFAALVASAYPDEGPDMWKYRLEVTALRGTADQRTDALGWGVVSPFDALTFTDIGTRFGPEHPNAAEHPAPARPAVASADLTSRENNLTIRAYIVSAIAVLGASLLGGLVILSHLRGRPAVVEDSEEDLS
ncbi:MAG: S8 family serine peptidase [Actinomyces sp.]|nr:S8 family serine peptidase [Actinomyces sp.]